MSDSSSDEDISFIPIQSSNKDKIQIKHNNNTIQQKSQFSILSKNPKWPDDLWENGLLIYNIDQNEKNSKITISDKLLKFDSKFESGNLSQVYHLGGSNYHLILEYDKNKSGSCQWFYFKIMNIKADYKYHFYLSGFHKSSGIFNSGSKVFWYSEKNYLNKGISWSRGGTNYSYNVTNTNKGKKRSTLQFSIKFPYDDDIIYLCYSLPYTYSDLLENLKFWSSIAPNNSLTIKTLCKTLGGRDCPLIIINSPGIPLENRQCLFFTGRIHPGESNGSYVLHGLIDFLLLDNPYSNYLRTNFIIYIIPMVSIDGVIEGFYRISLSGQDLNRIWDSPDQNRNPVVYNIKNLLKQISNERPIAAYLDFHGHSRLHGTFAYGCPNNTNQDNIFIEKNFPRIFSYLCDAFSWNNCVFSFPKERKAASRIVMRTEFNVINSFTIETSFGGINIGPRSGILHDEFIWKELGQKCGESLYHLFINENLSFFSSFVKQELLYYNPPNTFLIENKFDDFEYISAPISNDNDNNNNILNLNYKQPQLLKLTHPKSFFNINARIILNKSPGYCAPKWKQLSYNDGNL